MKTLKCKMKHSSCLLTLILASSLTFNANATISENNKTGFIPLQKTLMSPGLGQNSAGMKNNLIQLASLQKKQKCTKLKNQQRSACQGKNSKSSKCAKLKQQISRC
jgi:hypothetical protein